MTLILNDSGTDRLFCDGTQKFFGVVHEPVIFLVGCIELHHCEFRVVANVNTFVAEGAVEFKHAFKAADDQALQIKFRCDAQVHIHVERIVMGDERFGIGTAGDRMEHRSFHFHEVMFHHEFTSFGDRLGTDHEGAACAFVHDQIDIALTIAGFRIGEAVELIRQRTNVLGQQTEVLDADGKFAGLGEEQRAGCADDIADVDHLLEEVVSFIAHFSLGDKKLDVIGAVFDGQEAGFAHDAFEHDAAGNSNFDRSSFKLFRRLAAVGGTNFFNAVLLNEIIRISNAFSSEFIEFS